LFFVWQASLAKLLLFDRLDKTAQAKIVEHTWTRSVPAGEILIQEGETGLAASELYIVKHGTFEVSVACIFTFEVGIINIIIIITTTVAIIIVILL
jgi:hypothetical protein